MPELQPAAFLCTAVSCSLGAGLVHERRSAFSTVVGAVLSVEGAVASFDEDPADHHGGSMIDGRLRLEVSSTSRSLATVCSVAVMPALIPRSSSVPVYEPPRERAGMAARVASVGSRGARTSVGLSMPRILGENLALEGDACSPKGGREMAPPLTFAFAVAGFAATRATASCTASSIAAEMSRDAAASLTPVATLSTSVVRSPPFGKEA
mmetsp:Transcript_36047/g.94914  ORF Transcript_36047/g.94914 Transcript_36047/m.94914 type:complete len:209 (-) Transcript_36047:1823-2449(-)